MEDDIRLNNIRLIERFPFLLPRSRWTGDVPDDYDYEYTELDDMPDGWRKAFGEDICQEIMDELVANDCVEDYRIIQIKEKYGTLRWYDNWGTRKIHGEIIPKYEKLSECVCINCGAPATRYTTGWISPWCSTCAEKLTQPTISAREYFKWRKDGDDEKTESEEME